MYKIDTYGLIGNPVKHSQSPLIHKQFAKQTEQKMRYVLLPAGLHEFIKVTQSFIDKGAKGLNVTVPFKRQAWAFVHKKTERAQLAGAVNTIKVESNGQLLGDNTDGDGFIKDITKNYNISLKGKTVSILGAGGSVRGMIHPILQQHPARVVIVNRTVSKALDIVNQCKTFNTVEACSYLQLEGQQFDVIINATSCTLNKTCPPIPEGCLIENGYCYDLAYTVKNNPFFAWAKEHGAKQCIDGKGMLIEQAAESFYLWRGVKPDTKALL